MLSTLEWAFGLDTCRNCLFLSKDNELERMTCGCNVLAAHCGCGKDPASPARLNSKFSPCNAPRGAAGTISCWRSETVALFWQEADIVLSGRGFIPLPQHIKRRHHLTREGKQ